MPLSGKIAFLKFQLQKKEDADGRNYAANVAEIVRTKFLLTTKSVNC